MYLSGWLRFLCGFLRGRVISVEDVGSIVGISIVGTSKIIGDTHHY